MTTTSLVGHHFAEDEREALLNLMFARMPDGQFGLRQMVRWESVPKFVVAEDDSEAGRVCLEALVDEIRDASELKAEYREGGDVNIVFIVANNTLEAAGRHAELLAKFFPGASAEERDQKTRDFIAAQQEQDNFGQISVLSFERGIAGAMMFVTSKEETQIGRGVARETMKALGLVGVPGNGVASVMSWDDPADWLTDFDRRAIGFVYGGGLASGASKDAVEALLNG
ncbi:MAG: hypothetical protein AAF563_02360 [Pseudomonadota bacterium]